MRIYFVLFVWFIIVGGWIIFFGPGAPEPQCIACGRGLDLAIGVISVVLAVVGLATTITAGKRFTAGA